MTEAIKKMVITAIPRAVKPNFDAQRERRGSLYLFNTIRFATISFKGISLTYVSLLDIPRVADFCSIYFNDILFDVTPSAVKNRGAF